jgi:hypothetical protein
MLLNNYFGASADFQNEIYFEFAIVHFVNAFMFAWAWDEKSWTDFEMYPEYLNIIGASLYLWSSTLYGSIRYTNDDASAFTDEYYVCRYIELAAAIVELFAAFGWVFVWYVGYMEKYGSRPFPTPGRGFTLDDPDFHANWTLLCGAILYLVYNIQVLRSPELYSSDELYQSGDIVYFINSIFYMIAALRDYGWCWFMPTFGRCEEGEIVEVTPLLGGSSGASRKEKTGSGNGQRTADDSMHANQPVIHIGEDAVAC